MRSAWLMSRFEAAQHARGMSPWVSQMRLAGFFERSNAQMFSTGFNPGA